MIWTPTLADEPRQEAHGLAPANALFRKNGVLLVDDDPGYRSLFLAIAGVLGIPGRACRNLDELASFAELRNYDVMVLDYNLESLRGPEIAEYLDVFFAELPVIMISGDPVDLSARRIWPACIQRFIKKSAGPYEILQATVDVLKECEIT